MNAIQTDVLLVGAGPIGIELAVAMKKAGIGYVHLDADQVGSTIAWFAPQMQFFSSPDRIEIAGVPLQTVDQSKATREEYLSYLRSVVLQFDLEIRTYERVSRIERESGDGDFLVTSHGLEGETLWKASNVILAIGDMHRARQLGVPGEDLPHVSHYLGDPHTYFRRSVLIVGGKNSAVEAAIRCVRVGARVTLSYRGEEFDEDRIKYWLLPEIRSMARDGRVRFLPRTVVREIRRDVVILAPVDDADSDSSKELLIPAGCVLLLTGYEQDPDLFEQAGVSLEGPGRRPWTDPQTMETNVPGLFVAGTAVAGTQFGGVTEFIETSHVHVARIVAALRRTAPPSEVAPVFDQPES